MKIRLLSFMVIIGISTTINYAQSETTKKINKLGYETYDRLHIPVITLPAEKRSITIAVIDDGFRLSHNSLHNFIFLNTKEIPDNGKDDDDNGYTDDVTGWDISDHDNDVSIPVGREKDYYHGTMIAGIITTVAERSFGTNCSSHIKILPVKVLSNQSNSTYLKDGYEGIEYAVKMGADIICCAWSGGNLDERHRKLFEDAAKKGITIIASAGNLYKEDIPPPASVSSVFAVGAVDTFLRKLTQSSFGKKIDLVGFGEYVKAPYPDKDNAYTFGNGTSSAAALISGCAAVMKVVYPALSPIEIMKTLRNTAQPVDAENPSYGGKLGAGIPDLALAINYIAHPSERAACFNSARAKGDIIIDKSISKNTWEVAPVGGFHSIDFLVPAGNKNQQKGKLLFFTKEALYKSVDITSAYSKISIPGGYAKMQWVGKTDKAPFEISYSANPVDSTHIFCSDTRYFETASGEFSDGSGVYNYVNNIACKWQITTAKDKHIKIVFDELDTQDNMDYVYIFNGTATLPENLIAKFSGHTLPPVVISPGNEVLLWFVTDKTITGKGWHLNYNSVEDEPGYIFPKK